MRGPGEESVSEPLRAEEIPPLVLSEILRDEYLCIVPDRSAGSADVFLPFEGDATLAIVLSKAFLLAEDTKIKDETITRQIRRA